MCVQYKINNEFDEVNTVNPWNIDKVKGGLQHWGV